jgi:hypothetical protein
VLYLDDGPALPNPYQLTVTPDANTHLVRAAAPGFTDRVEELRLDSSKEVQLTLATLTLATGSRLPSVKPKANTETTSHTATQPPGPGELPKVVTKRPRVLDPDNPFGQP